MSRRTQQKINSNKRTPKRRGRAQQVAGEVNRSVSGGWIPYHRFWLDDAILGFLKPEGTPRNGKVTHAEAWIDLYCLAQWRDNEVQNKQKLIRLSPGQLIGGRAWLARRWGWTENEVRWFLEKLENYGRIFTTRATTRDPGKNHQRSGHYANIITINDYNTFQTVRELDGLLKSSANHQSPAKTPPEEPPQLNNKKYKTSSSPSEFASPREGAWQEGSDLGDVPDDGLISKEEIAKWRKDLAELAKVKSPHKSQRFYRLSHDDAQAVEAQARGAASDPPPRYGVHLLKTLEHPAKEAA